MWQKIKALREERGVILADMKAILDKAEAEKRELVADESARFDELSGKAEAKLTEVNRYEKLHGLERAGAQDQNQAGPGRHDIDPERRDEEDAGKGETRSEFLAYLRGKPLAELRALTVGGMGVVGDRPFYSQLVTSMKGFAGVREAGATVLPTVNGNPLSIPMADDTANVGQIVAEGATDNTAVDATVTTKTLNAYKFDSKWIKISTEMLRDSEFPIEKFILDIAAERIGRYFNAETTNGDGTGEPEGFLVGGTSGATSASNNAIDYEDLLDLVHSVDPAYRASGRCVFMFSDLTLAAIRKLKDGDNRYVFSPGEAGVPGSILGYRYIVNNNMPELSAGVSSKVVAFGDFSKYFVRDVTTPDIVVARELFAGDGLVGYRVLSRHDGKLTDAKAVKYLKLAAS
jgi:HK97 family phage major capsid protein